MAKWVMEVIYSIGYAGILMLMFAENVFPPIPSELIMPLAGFMTADGKFTFPAVVIAGTIGSVLGSLPLYYAGRGFGEERLKKLADRHGRWVTVSARDIERAKKWFDKYGGWALLLCRLIPGVRSLISIPAGLGRMNAAMFLLYTTIGMAVWTTFLASLGYFLRANFGKVEEYLNPISYVVLAGLIIFYIYRVITHKKRDSGK
jgi:membrane protein DedA with SNARE-associated domain